MSQFSFTTEQIYSVMNEEDSEKFPITMEEFNNMIQDPSMQYVSENDRSVENANIQPVFYFLNNSLNDPQLNGASAYQQIPANVEFPGKYNFVAQLSSKSAGRKNWDYSQQLQKVYINMEYKLPVVFKWMPPDANLMIRARVLFLQPQHANENVRRCIQHSDPKDLSNRDCSSNILPHVIRCHDPNSEYVVESNGALSVRTPLGALQAGCDGVMLLYSFMCKNSCASGMNRKPIEVVYTLEDMFCNVLGRRKYEVRVCSCPKRDREKEEKTSNPDVSVSKKRKSNPETSMNKRPMIKVEQSDNKLCTIPSFEVVGPENVTKILNYAYDLMAGDAARHNIDVQNSESHMTVMENIQSLIERTQSKCQSH